MTSPEGVTVRAATADEVDQLPALQVAAGARFRELGMDLVADGPPPQCAELAQAQAAGHLLVAILEGTVVGFVRLRPLDGALHVEQVSVAPGWSRRGIGRSLMLAAETLASARGFSRMTLTTFRDVPFNGPFYARLGWSPVDDARLTSGLAQERRQEDAAGLDRWPRVAMAKVVGGGCRSRRQSGRGGASAQLTGPGSPAV
ncbi:MAG TPA: GNAT family N-acetyltransferase [Motilibacteraceae bacterium]|nr:GNAT family N-acetyltransferase [Motilibacteraceae bacterium]